MKFAGITAGRRTAACVCAAAALLGALHCRSTDPRRARFASWDSAHFTIYFCEEDYTLQEIQHIAARKERLLDHINAYMKMSFDKRIIVELNGSSGYGGRAHWDEYRITESRGYVAQDDGHEIAHIVIADAWGKSRCRFLVEGLAVACEVSPASRRAVESISRACGSDPEPSCKDSLYRFIRNGLCESKFETDRWHYAQAGAFMKHLLHVYGPGRVGECYRHSLSCVSPAVFEKIFGLRPHNEINAYLERLFWGGQW